MQNDKDFTQELTAIARLLTLQPNKRIARKITHELRIYEIEDKATNKLLSFILVQLVRKPLPEIKGCPVKIEDLREIAKMAALAEKPYSVLFYFPSHFGLWLGADFFSIDDLPKASNNKDIALIPMSNLRLLYEIQGKEQFKIDADSL